MMHNAHVHRISLPTRPKQLLTLGLLVMVVFAALWAWSVSRTSKSTAPTLTPISQQTLEQQYGLRVQLLAVTAAGGMVDLRLQIVNAEKAKAFLSDPKQYPVLRVENDVILRTSDAGTAQQIQFEDGKSIFALFPNSGNVLKPGDPVHIEFGTLQVEAIQSR